MTHEDATTKPVAAGERMQSDRELLEKAASAAGHKWRWFGKDFCTERNERTGLHMPWNPLEDDGDALRLAVKLRLRVSVYLYVVEVCENLPHHGWVIRGEQEYMGDLADATRRAIVGAAAAIGRRQHE